MVGRLCEPPSSEAAGCHRSKPASLSPSHARLWACGGENLGSSETKWRLPSDLEGLPSFLQSFHLGAYLVMAPCQRRHHGRRVIALRGLSHDPRPDVGGWSHARAQGLRHYDPPLTRVEVVYRACEQVAERRARVLVDHTLVLAPAPRYRGRKQKEIPRVRGSGAGCAPLWAPRSHDGPGPGAGARRLVLDQGVSKVPQAIHFTA
jgi:hypothetical protein